MTVNYDQIAVRYDAHRPSGSDLCFDRLAEALAGARRILEIGAGTGNTTRFVARSTDATLVAMEPSAGMVAQARAKGVAGAWIRGEAPLLPFRSDSFDVVYSSYVLQHVGAPLALFEACARMLRPGTPDPGPRLRPSRGTHLLFPALTRGHGIVARAASDGRVWPTGAAWRTDCGG